MADEKKKKTTETVDTVNLNESVERKYDLDAKRRKDESEQKKKDSN